MNTKGREPTSQDVKTRLMHIALWGNKALCVQTECLNNSDVLEVNKRLYSTEYEIKVSRSDLLSEIKCINAAVKKLHDRNLPYNKMRKHENYLIDKLQSQFFTTPRGEKIPLRGKQFIPNYFYFVIPKRLWTSDIGEMLAFTDYGVIIFDLYQGFSDIAHTMPKTSMIMETKKVAKKLHTEKIDQAHLYQVMHRCSYEVLNLMEKIYDKDY